MTEKKPGSTRRKKRAAAKKEAAPTETKAPPPPPAPLVVDPAQLAASLGGKERGYQLWRFREPAGCIQFCRLTGADHSGLTAWIDPD